MASRVKRIPWNLQRILAEYSEQSTRNCYEIVLSVGPGKPSNWPKGSKGTGESHDRLLDKQACTQSGNQKGKSVEDKAKANAYIVTRGVCLN